MTDNVVHLPRPRPQRPSSDGLGFFVRVGRNDHLEMQHLLAVGERGIYGFVLDAHNVDRHRDLITEARRLDFDIIIDPKTQQMGLPGGNTSTLALLPWGLERHHNTNDFTGSAGQEKALQMVELAATAGATQILGPTHILSGAGDPWLVRDIAMMNYVADEINRGGHDLGLIYSLAVPMTVLRNNNERRHLITSIADAPCDAVWLKVENFGDDATGEKTAAYILACRDFHARGVPVIGDHVGGLPGLGALAFGAVGGIAHGVTMQQNFKASAWRRPPVPSTGMTCTRVYIPQLDMLLKPKVAENLITNSPRIRSLCACRDTHCCPHGLRDMLNHPARHAIYQRAREIERLASAPASVRASHYLNDSVRRVSDQVASVAAFPGLGEEVAKPLLQKQKEMARLRDTVAHLLDDINSTSTAMSPIRRQRSTRR